MPRPQERLRLPGALLRRPTSADAAALQRVVTESLEHLRPWMPWAEGDYPVSAAVEFIDTATRHWHSGQSYTYLITTGGHIAGTISLEQRIGDGGLEIGYWLHPEHTGRGLMTAAARAVTEQAFALPEVRRVEIWHDAANTASRRIPERLGFACVEEHRPPRFAPAPGRAGVDVVWRMAR
ncbi:GNAT family N-acetyltransferase [Saccharopolyspora dendranthemae]|uniref:RimJ/RimL family protein N-acetyltransferase n=1 Tax=Saccharopolyspora dendranthemae TaxID=1181886 RepID=A0A561U9A8_9PSEU|nr:GNAT family N-acetyltransferase [Saccharopolyspora dendranthemae]TWF95927.1 RimJ/RimL family protein N-acetyltransferase [Saccharopolyspora dendranthemae]